MLGQRTLHGQWFLPPYHGEASSLGNKTSHAYLNSVVEIDVGIMCGCFPALPQIFVHAKSTVSSSKLGRIGLRDSSIFKWFRLGSDNSITKSSDAKKMKVTLSSGVNGQGNFLNSKSLFGTKTQETDSIDISLVDFKPSMQISIRNASPDDIEPGLLSR